LIGCRASNARAEAPAERVKVGGIAAAEDVQGGQFNFAASSANNDARPTRGRLI
jgi:hypothetical protein